MKTFIKYTSLLVVLFSVFSCEKNITIKLRDEDNAPKIVAICYISPQDTLITVGLTKSNPLYITNINNNHQFTVIKNASVKISDGTITQTLAFDALKGKYTVSAKAFPITGGKTYKLEVDVAGFATVTATTTVPLTNNTTLKVDTETVNAEGGGGLTSVTINAKWGDIAGEVNYYQVVYVGIRKDYFTKDTIYSQLTTYAVNDSYKDGLKLEVTSRIPIRRNGQKSNQYAYDNCDVYLFNASKEYYDLQRSLENYTPDDPFTEPTPIYTNIANGLGIFAGYNGYKVRF